MKDFSTTAAFDPAEAAAPDTGDGWMPPEAPLEMPRQTVEAQRAPRRLGALFSRRPARA